MSNPANTDTDSEGALRRLAAAADGGPHPMDGTDPVVVAAPAANSETAAEPSAADAPSDAGDPNPRAAERARKEADRRERSWNALDEEKSRYRQEREAFEQERREFLQEREAAGASRGNTAAADDAAPNAPGEPATGAADPAMARLREDVARHKAEIARLTQLTSLYNGAGTGGTPPAPVRKFEELGDREMETELRRMARGLDGF